jgi:hydroxymethylglutaryl-CoA reductase (NADPH)
MKIRNFATIEERRKFLEKKKGMHFAAIKVFPKDMEVAQFRNCENMIGAVQLPLGIAGPLKIKGSCTKGEYFIPLATTEAALVASINRGCKAVTNAGGVQVYTEQAGITRGSIFETSGLSASFKFKKWLTDNFLPLARKAQETSSHLKLLKLETRIVGRSVYVRFSFDTMDAMGMNMATIATDKVAHFIARETGIVCVSLAGNFDIDKKPAWLNFILGRGRQVWAEAVLSEKVVKEVLKTTLEKIHQVSIKKCLVGSALSGSLGFNAHFANIIAAIFIACGQDPAHIVEGSLGITTTDLIDKKLYISIYLPDLVLGTVGGGTSLPSQKEALSFLGVWGGSEGRNADVLAEIVGGAVLAGELSLLAALSEGSLALAHQKLARSDK